MPWRNPLIAKKRGTRRTGTRMIGHWGELLLSLSLVIVGGGALALHVTRVMLPEWRASNAMQGFKPGVCQIIGTRIHRRDIPLAVAEFSLELEASRLTNGEMLPPVWIDLGFEGLTPSRDDAEHLAQWYKPGDEHPCWYDPDDSSHLYLRRPYAWWPWPVAFIPASLLAVGLWGIAASLMQVATSAERRSVVAEKASRLAPGRESSSDPTSPPSPNTTVASSSLQFPHRLPVSGTTAWRTLGLFFVCTVWNALLVYLGYVAAGHYRHGDPPWLTLGLVVILGLIGVWLAFHLVRELWDRRGIGATFLEITDHPLTLGGEYQAQLTQTGNMQLQSYSVCLVSEESASYQQGTDSRTLVETVYCEELQSLENLSLQPGEPLLAEWNFEIPATAMHSFRSPHNEIRWQFLVRGITSQGQKLTRRFALTVRPTATNSTDANPPEATA